jgi:O-antigen/teichoic acid export membrane protein
VYHKFVKDLTKYLPSQLLPALTSFISTPILTRLFLPAEYGNYALALGMSDLAYALSSSGFGSGVLRFYPAYKAKSALSTFFVTISVSAGAAITSLSVVGLFILLCLRRYLPVDLYPLLLISIPVFCLQAIFEMASNIVRAQERSGLYTLFQLLARYGSLGLGILLVVVFGLQVKGLLWGNLLALTLAIPFLLRFATKGVIIRSQHLQYADVRQMWNYAWPLALGNVAMWGLRLSDRYILGAFRSGSEVGVYSVAYNLSGKSVDILVALFLLGLGPMVMNVWETQGRMATENALAMITRLYLILCLPAAAGITMLALPFVSLLASDAYRDGHRIVGYVAFSSFVWGLTQIANRALLIRKVTWLLAIHQIIAAVVNVSLNLLLVPAFGFVAAGITTLVGYIVLFGLQAHSSRRYLSWLFPFRTLQNVTIATLFMGLAILGLGFVSVDRVVGHIGYLLLSVAVAVSVYFASLWLLGEASEGERGAVRRLWYRVSARLV